MLSSTLKQFGTMGFLCALTYFASAGEQVAFQSNFSENQTLKGWHDIWDQRGRKPVRAEYYQVVTENGETYFRTNKTKQGRWLSWGIWHRLGSSGIPVDDHIQEIRIEAVLRKKAELINYTVGIGITSNQWCDQGRTFIQGKQDSGIEIIGNENPKHQKINKISSKIEGFMTTLTAPREPFNFMLKTGEWQTWKLIYDHEKKEVKFYRSPEETKPFLIQRDVNLKGIILQSVWISGGTAEFKSVKVTVKTK